METGQRVTPVTQLWSWDPQHRLLEACQRSRISGTMWTYRIGICDLVGAQAVGLCMEG